MLDWISALWNKRKQPKFEAIPVLDEHGNEVDPFVAELVNTAWNEGRPVIGTVKEDGTQVIRKL